MDDVDPLWKKVRDAVDKSIPVIELHTKELTPVLSVWWLMDKDDIERAHKAATTPPNATKAQAIVSIQARHLLKAIMSLHKNVAGDVLRHLACAEYYATRLITEEKDDKGA